MANQKSYDIAVIFPEWYSFLNDVMESILGIRGIRHHCHFRNFVSKDFNLPVEFPQGYQPDGIICSYDDDSYEAEWLNALGIPIVNIFSSDKKTHPTVSSSYESVSKLVVDHFSALGYQEIGLLHTLGMATAEKMRQAFEEKCSKLNIPFWAIPVPDGIPAGDWSKLEQTAPGLKEKLLGCHRKTGIFTSHDTRGRLLADYCTELGIAVPDRVGILGRFDSINARLCTPELSSVIMPSKRIGTEAVQFLVQLIEGKEVANQHICVETSEIRVRESTVGKDNPDMIVLRARQLIREKSCEGITVDELAQALPIARSTFEKRYRALTGMSPAQEIRKIRENTARELLLTTQQSIEEIASNIGFTDPRPFVVFFKREVGMTPGEFRKENCG